MECKTKIVITGFGPFGYHLINDSASCLDIIKHSGLNDEIGVDIVTSVLDVIYDVALHQVQDLWSFHKPFMMVHIGVHNKKDVIVIEKCARKSGYCNLDTTLKCPEGTECPFGEEDRIFSKIDVEDIVAKCSPGRFKLCSSENAGLYLCEFVYYISLSHEPSKVLFIHIPPYTPSDLLHEKAEVVKEIIKLAYIQLAENSSTPNSIL